MGKEAAAFAIRHQREPTFWLDKVCIDQSNLIDGLKALPINVMACSQMLMLHGPSYQHRLWCVWELFSLMAFADFEVAVEKLRIVPTETRPGAPNAGTQLSNFQLSEAHCYDPNDEARLRWTIHTVGADTFMQSIRSLGRAAC